MPRYEETVVVVTGAGRGLGAGIAARFAGEGAKVVLADRDAVVEETAGALDAGALGVVADVTSEADVDALFAAAREAFGRVDVVINNAGIITIRRLEELTLGDWERVLRVNTTSST